MGYSPRAHKESDMTEQLSTAHGVALRLGAPQRRSQGRRQIWEHGLLLGLDQGEEELPGLLPCVRDNMEPLLE